MSKKFKVSSLIIGQLISTWRLHLFRPGECLSLCGSAQLAHIESQSISVASKRRGYTFWPEKDLNYCGRCRISLRASEDKEKRHKR